jgi:hypothetical protein
MNVPPPPPRPSADRPAAVFDWEKPTAPVVNEESCDRPRTSVIVIRWDAVMVVIATLFVGVVIGMGIQFALDHSVPACTDEIAYSGGVCIGEPR